MGDAAAQKDTEKERRERLHLRSQSKREADDARDKQERKQRKLDAEHDLVASIGLTSPFLCRDPQPSLQSRYEWAIEWSERQTLSKLPKEFDTVEVRGEIISFLKSNTKVIVLCAYFGIAETSFYRYQKKCREQQESKLRVSKLQEREVRLFCIELFRFITTLKF